MRSVLDGQVPQGHAVTNDIERHSPEVWRKAADSLRGEADASDAVAKVNRNGAPLLGDTRDLFRPKTGDIPAQPGVYKWRDGEGRVIYVGKAKSLRNRLANYFQPLYLLHPRTQTMVLTARSLEWTVVGTELEAFTLEYTWIKEFDPRFNVQFRDDKTYPYLAISSGEAVPRVWVTRSRKRRDARYFGPYAKVWELRQSLDKLLRTFPVRTCTTNVFHKAELTGRPCLLASIGKCSAPCIGRIAPKEHRRMCEQLVGVMTGRLGKSYIAQLTRDMKDASAELEFEKAARLRDEIQMLQTVMQQNAVVFDQDVDADVFGMASDELEASVHAFIVRDGSIRGERNWSVERVEDVSDGELIDDLIMQVYSDVAADNGLNVDPHDGTDPSMASLSGNGGVSTAEGGASIVERRDAIGSTQTVTAKSSVERAQATRTGGRQLDGDICGAALVHREVGARAGVALGLDEILIVAVGQAVAAIGFRRDGLSVPENRHGGVRVRRGDRERDAPARRGGERDALVHRAALHRQLAGLFQIAEGADTVGIRAVRQRKDPAALRVRAGLAVDRDLGAHRVDREGHGIAVDALFAQLCEAVAAKTGYRWNDNLICRRVIVFAL